MKDLESCQYCGGHGFVQMRMQSLPGEPERFANIRCELPAGQHRTAIGVSRDLGPKIARFGKQDADGEWQAVWKLTHVDGKVDEQEFATPAELNAHYKTNYELV